MIDLQEFGYQGSVSNIPDGLIPARIIELHRGLYKAICLYGAVEATLKGSFLHRAEDTSDYPAVGDFVLLRYNGADRSSIVKVLPRRSKFSRTDFSGHAVGYVKTVLEQVVAANFDFVFIMSSLNQDFNVNRIARYLTQARMSGGIPIVILTKADLCANCEEHMSTIRELAGDIAIIPISSHTGAGLEALASYLRSGTTIVFLGMSGVGKSSLLNALAGSDVMAVNNVREGDARGRHTTTHRQLIRLPSGAMVIDTPGMRELGLWDAQDGISAAFEDVEALIARCRFSDCRHTTEPGCAVLAALVYGNLAPKRWDSYLAQRREVALMERKAKSAKRRK